MKPSVSRLFLAVRESAGIGVRGTAADKPAHMASIANGMQQVLDLAVDYSSRPTPAMRARSRIADDLAARLSPAFRYWLIAGQ